MNFGEAIKSFWTKYATFSGRSSRSEFWFAYLFLVLAGIAAGFIEVILGLPYDASTGYGPLTILFTLAYIIPFLAVTWRRFHDIDKSGAHYFYILIPLVGVILVIIWLATKGTPEANRFGDPVV